MTCTDVFQFCVDRRKRFASVMVVAAFASPLMAEASTQPPTPQGSEATQNRSGIERAEPDEPDGTYRYTAAGRRDPFLSLLGRNPSSVPATPRPRGLPGLSLDELSLQGLVFADGQHLAVMQAPDEKSYILRGEEQLFDAIVKSVSAESVTFLQAVSDPLSLVKEPKVLRTLEGREENP